MFTETATDAHFDECWPDEDVLTDIKEEIAESLADMQHLVDRGISPMQPKSQHQSHFEAARRILCNDKWIAKCFAETSGGVSKRPCVCGDSHQQEGA